MKQKSLLCYVELPDRLQHAKQVEEFLGPNDSLQKLYGEINVTEFELKRWNASKDILQNSI